eukprot:scaffold609_cov170-Amphora_coffeaeformis.AAC.24
MSQVKSQVRGGVFAWRWMFVLVCLGYFFVTTSAQGLRGNDNSIMSKEDEEQQTEQHRELQTGDAMREKFQMEKAKFFEKLEVDYGEFTDALFLADHPTIPDKQSSLGRITFMTAVPNANVSWTRLVRKMAIKIADAKETKFVWATGGHSASAGHGNLFEESYTNVLDRAAAPIFQSVGIEFHARSYAMGGTPSGLEIASCAKEVFGTDVDLVSWDYGMCDGREYNRNELYARRVAMIPTMPAVVSLNPGRDGGRRGVMEHLTNLGMTALVMNDKELTDRFALLPNCAEIDQDTIDALPKYVKYFQCGGGVENGEVCGAHKWTDTGDDQCEKRKFRTSWHPGWKHHAFEGNVWALFLMEIIDDALELLKSPEAVGEPALFVEKLRKEERSNYEKLLASNDFQHRKYEQEIVDASLDTIYMSPNYCHTARIPAEQRFLGILTGRAEGHTVKTPVADIDKGVLELTAARKADVTPSEMPLVYDGSHRQPCGIMVQNDFKDFYFVAGKYSDYVSHTIPADADISYYGRTDKLRGVVAVCDAACGWHCPAETLDAFSSTQEGTTHWKVNGQPVHSITKWDQCVLLKRTEDSVIWDANAQGKFEISVKVDDASKYLRLSSFMVW